MFDFLNQKQSTTIESEKTLKLASRRYVSLSNFDASDGYCKNARQLHITSETKNHTHNDEVTVSKRVSGVDTIARSKPDPSSLRVTP